MDVLGVPQEVEPGVPEPDRVLTPPAPSGGILDRRLLGLGRPVRWFLAAAVALGAGTTILVIVRAVLLARIISGAFRGDPPAELSGPIAGLALVAVAAAGIAWATEVAAHHSAAGVISSLRRRLVTAALDPRSARIPHGEIVVAAGRSIEALDAYFARYLPGVVLAFVTPVAVVGSMLVLDLWSGIIVIATLPLIPLFAALIGSATRARVARRRDALAALGAGLLESLRALPMLKAFGRSRERTALIADLADGHRRETMGVLRIAFLSALALELAATISVAVVAVAVGLRVLEGVLDLEPALTVLVLAPEAYVPLRRVAGEFHSAAEGVEAAGRIFEMSPDPASDPAESPPGASAPIGRPPRITLEGLEVHRRGSAALRELSIDIEAGSWLALTGPSGSGKSTLLAAVLGLAPLHRGRIVVDGEDVGEDLGRWRGRIGWVPQDPHLFPGSIAANVRFGLPGADDDDIEAALRLAACDFVFALPEGAATEIGERGSLLSAGERARVALARALVRRPDVLILDEPTAHLDALTEAAVLDAVARLRPAVTIIVAAHRPEAARRADRIVALGDPARGEECR